MLRACAILLILGFPLSTIAAEPPAVPEEEAIQQSSAPPEQTPANDATVDLATLFVISDFRPVRIQELDTSITVFDRQTIELATIEHFEELVQLVPNMNLSGEGSRARYFQLRGIGEREQYEGAPNPSVGFIVDDINLSGVGGVASLFDIDRVEVLRGPQSSRFGSSALAGFIYMRSTEPDGEFSADMEATVGEDDIRSLGAAVGGPLGDSFSGRVSLHHFESNGFRRNAFLQRDDTNGRDETTARGKLRWAGASGWEALLSGLYADFDNGYDAFAVDNSDVVHSDNPGHDSQETRAGSLRISGPLGNALDLVSITSLARSDVLFSFDGDWGNDDFWSQYGSYEYDFVYINPRRRDAVSQEFRLVSSPAGRLFGTTADWVLGVYGERLEEHNRIDSTGLYDDTGEENFCPPCLTDRQITSDYEADTLALFGGMDVPLNEKLGLSVGLRFERWDADYRDTWQDINFPDNPPGGDSCTLFNCSPSEDLWGGHIALSYDWSETVRGYGRIARGFKAGGFNPSLAALQGVAVLGPEFIAYGPEYLWNYELGLKGVWRQGALVSDIAVFYMDRDDAQLSQSSQQIPFDPNSFVYVTYNGDARSWGAEASLAWQANDAWQLHGALGLLDTEIKASPKTEQVSPNAINRDLAHAPPYTLNLGATWTGPGGWFGRVDLNAMGAFFFDISHNQKSQAYELVNLRIGKAWGHWAVSAWGRNLFDEDYSTRGFFFGNEPPDFADTLYTKFGDPRTVGITVTFNHPAW